MLREPGLISGPVLGGNPRAGRGSLMRAVLDRWTAEPLNRSSEIQRLRNDAAVEGVKLHFCHGNCMT